jgi:hypothetical protein
MSTIVALRGRVVVRIDVKSIIWAGLHAGFATNAAVIVEIDNSVFPRIKRLHWADLNTGCVGTMIAAHYGEDSPCIGKLSLFNLFNIGSVDTDGNIVLTFTGRGACVTTDAFSIVNNKSVSHWKEASFRLVDFLRKENSVGQPESKKSALGHLLSKLVNCHFCHVT